MNMPFFQEARFQLLQHQTRRHFLKGCATGLGAMWFASQMNSSTRASEGDFRTHAPKVKRIIALHMLGAPSQLELFDFKPDLKKYDGQECPAEYLKEQRFAFIQGTPKMLGPQFPFAQYGDSGSWVSDRLPHFTKVVDDVCFIRSMQTDQFNHGPAELMMHTGQPRIGYPGMGTWVTWGLGTENENLPGFMVLLSGGRPPRVGNALWGSGFLPSVHQGVQCRSQGDPVLNVSNPPGVTRDMRRSALDSLNLLNELNHQEFGDPETLTRIAQYEMSFKMQMTVPEAMDISTEPESVCQAYGVKRGATSFANNCLLARRLAERGVRFIQLLDWGWDSHGSTRGESLKDGFVDKCRDLDQPMAALLADLKQRGLLEDTLVIWGGEFGRTSMRENRGGTEMSFVGRDHNPNAFTMWLAGAGIKSGFSYGQTDDMGYLAAESPVQVRDLHATILHLLGIDHEKMIVPYQGLNQKLTGVKPARVVKEILA